MELVSAIIPTHNRADLLLKAIESILNQTYKNIEIIIIDDASTDDTEEVVLSLKNDKITYHKVIESKGGNHARNLGAEKARGKYIAFLDDDDIWREDKIQKQVAALQNNEKAGLVYTGSKIIYTNSGNTYVNSPQKKGDLSKEILMKNYVGTTSSVLLEKAVFLEAGGFDNDMPALQDYDLWVRVAQIAEIEAVDEPLINYYYHTKNGQISDNFEKITKAISIFDKKYESKLQALGTAKLQEKMMLRTNGLGKRMLRMNKGKEARAFFKDAFKKKANLMSVLLYLSSFINYSTLIKVRNLAKS